jgi:hypothetical protein
MENELLTRPLKKFHQFSLSPAGGEGWGEGECNPFSAPSNMSLHWFFDDLPEEYLEFRKEATRIEEEHLKLRVALRDAEAALRTEPGNAGLQTRVKELQKKLEELEKQAPWLTSDRFKEFDLWGVPH